MVTREQDLAIRTAAFDWLTARLEGGRSLLRREELLEGLTVHGEHIRLIDTTRGIRNPRQLLATLSVTSGLAGGSVASYDDGIDLVSGTVRYAYQRGEGNSNRKLEAAAELQLPIIHFTIVEPGLLAASYPVYVEAHPADRYVSLHMDAVRLFHAADALVGVTQRSYRERSMWERIHQPAFRGMVMRAYVERCAICRLAHAALLDAAHIRGDKHELGLPVTSNGLALCKIHHRAYDVNVLGISPDRRVVIPDRILREHDGPMLRHGLQEMHGMQLHVPVRSADQPDRASLEERFLEFTAATADA